MSKFWFIAIYCLLVISAAAAITMGIMFEDAALLTAAGVLGLLVTGSSLPIAINLNFNRPSISATTPAASQTDDLLGRILDNSMLSDNAKRVLFRERELELLRRSIEEDISKGAYDAAITLCEDMANQFGYREEAEAFRTRIDQVRDEQYEAHVDTALNRLDALLAERNWSAAHNEAARIRRLYPDSHLIEDLDVRIMHARDEHRNELEARFLQLAQSDNVEEAMRTLKELDRYLTREEAERLAEVAQGVIVKHRDNLGVQFKIAVNEHRWAEASLLGKTIIDEFPNTQMAVEVSSMIEVLRTRATQAALAAKVK